MATCAAAGLATYVVLHLTFPSHGKAQLFQHVHQQFGFATYAGLGLAVASVVAVRLATRTATTSTEFVRRRRLLWLFSTPYVIVCIVYGLWNEAPRLIFPLLLGEYLIALEVARRRSVNGSSGFGGVSGYNGDARRLLRRRSV
jgi:membrane-associated HD superfamily phosphohydrolase